jgi:hypothetical protein
MATWDRVCSKEGRSIQPEVAAAVLPATLVGYVLPAALVCLVPLTASGVSQSHFNIQSFATYAFLLVPTIAPILTALAPRVAQYVRRSADRVGQRHKRKTKVARPSQDHTRLDILRSLRKAYATAFAIQATQHLYTIARNVIETPRGQRSVVLALRQLLTYPAIPGQKYSSLTLYSVATLGFGLYTVWELRRRDMVSRRAAMSSAAGVLAGQFLFGPGATYAGLWWWREGVLTKV